MLVVVRMEIVIDEDNNDGDNTVLICSGDNPVYLADNGVTIKACDDANVGDTGVVNGYRLYNSRQRNFNKYDK